LFANPTVQPYSQESTPSPPDSFPSPTSALLLRSSPAASASATLFSSPIRARRSLVGGGTPGDEVSPPLPSLGSRHGGG
jgi:hypothetical protein